MESDKMLIPKQRAYKAYIALQQKRIYFKDLQSKCRHAGEKEEVLEWGIRASIIGECMHVLANEFDLKFEQ